VRIYLGEIELGTTTAASNGTFSLRSAIPELPLGRYRVRSSCGKLTGDPDVDLSRPQANKGAAGIAAAGVTTSSTFLFFLLLGKLVVSFMSRPRG
jgi:hypothetical protein